MNNSINKTETDDYLNSETIFEQDSSRNIERNQYTDGDNKNDQFSSSVTYRLPLIGNEFFADFNYSYSRNKQENSRSTYDVDPATGEYSEENDFVIAQ